MKKHTDKPALPLPVTTTTKFKESKALRPLAYNTGGGKGGKGTKGKSNGTKGNGKYGQKGKSKGSKGKNTGDSYPTKGGKTNTKGKHNRKGTSNTSHNSTDTGYFDALGRRIPSPHRGKGKGKYGPTGKGKGNSTALYRAPYGGNSQL